MPIALKNIIVHETVRVPASTRMAPGVDVLERRVFEVYEKVRKASARIVLT